MTVTVVTGPVVIVTVVTVTLVIGTVVTLNVVTGTAGTMTVVLVSSGIARILYLLWLFGAQLKLITELLVQETQEGTVLSRT